jgi:hypothetical protein
LAEKRAAKIGRDIGASKSDVEGFLTVGCEFGFSGDNIEETLRNNRLLFRELMSEEGPVARPETSLAPSNPRKDAIWSILIRELSQGTKRTKQSDETDFCGMSDSASAERVSNVSRETGISRPAVGAFLTVACANGFSGTSAENVLRNNNFLVQEMENVGQATQAPKTIK